MHLGNGAITPECAVVTWGAAAAGLSWLALRKPDARTQPLAVDPVQVGCWAALVFALQAINLPVLPWASAHLVGGVLLARVLGPKLGAWTMAGVILVQAVAMGDGGLLAWGCNVINMALLPTAGVLLWERIASRQSSKVGEWAVLSGWSGLAILAAAVLIPLETAAGRSEPLVGWNGFVATMLVTHLAVAVLEAGLTFAFLAAAARLQALPSFALRSAIAGSAVVLGLAGMVLSSSLPDGYEFSVETANLLSLLDGLATVETSALTEWLTAAAAALVVGFVAAAAAHYSSRRQVASLS